MNKYLVFDSTDENKELLKKYNDGFNGIRDEIKEINSNKCDYQKKKMFVCVLSCCMAVSVGQ